MNDKKKIRAIIVEDSIVKKELLLHILNSDPDIDVVATASDGETAIRYIKSKKPDIVTMDVNMPGMNGFETTRRILKECPIPIVIISTIRTAKNKKEVSKAMMESGALYFLDTPPGPWHPDFDLVSKRIVRIIKSMSHLKVVTRRYTTTNDKSSKKTDQKPIKITDYKSDISIVAIGVSTGGPPLLKDILSKLPADYKMPIVIVQHISAGFDQLLANNLNKACEVVVKLAEEGEIIRPKTVYIAPGSTNLIINTRNKISLISNPTEFNSIVPSADALFNSVSKVFNSSAVGILLTGMGRDGAKELKGMKERGAVTIIQDEASSAVFGMPGEAKAINAENYTMTPDEITKYLIKLHENGK
jgi:two-component system, chemotaxis family, protein-glutamate methylesterase/glutaminase